MGVQEPKKRTNFELARGINAISANSLAKTNGRVFAHSAANSKTKAQQAPQAVHSTKKWYPADYIPKPLPSAKTKRNSVKTAKLRKSITPGTVLILLSGRFRGKRVVFLKQLQSGTLLVTGPYKVNGVPLRRVNQAFVIATSTRMDLSDVQLPEIDDDYFTKDKPAKKSSKEERFFASQQTPTTPVIAEQRKKDQKTVDALLMQKLASEPYLRAYLNAKFTLTKNDRVHDMRF
ncbi:60S ribosomal protein L6 [Phytophthora megakarya]|uniref:60S ribosomal protein L6 n=1 Tax=Phytophthora megakarya TaxID=4795 RepID=A0A225X0C9_9STRA|nr:60S ribosomal protein L6 [Phytophthora megakarya]